MIFRQKVRKSVHLTSITILNVVFHLYVRLPGHSGVNQLGGVFVSGIYSCKALVPNPQIPIQGEQELDHGVVLHV